jgi:hypothetical protein
LEVDAYGFCVGEAREIRPTDMRCRRVSPDDVASPFESRFEGLEAGEAYYTAAFIRQVTGDGERTVFISGYGRVTRGGSPRYKFCEEWPVARRFFHQAAV